MTDQEKFLTNEIYEVLQKIHPHIVNFMLAEALVKEGFVKLGATRSFPQGKLRQDDEGELRLAIAVKDKKVIIDFGKPVTWVGLDKHTAMAFGSQIINKAESL